MTSDNIPWGDSALVPGTSLSQQEGYMQAQRLHPMAQRIFPETVATPSNTGHKAILCERYARTRNCLYGTSCKLWVSDNITLPPFSIAALASIILPSLSLRIDEQKAVDPCGFATTTSGAYVVGNTA